MIRIKVMIAFFSFILLVSSSTFPQDKLKIAVLGFESMNVAPTTAELASDAFRNELLTLDKYSVMSKVQTEKFFKENTSIKPLCSSLECALETGKALNVSQLVTGSLARKNRNYLVTVKVTDISAGRLTFTDTLPCERESQFGNISKILLSRLSEQEKSAPSSVKKAETALPVDTTKTTQKPAAPKASKENIPAPSANLILSEKEDAALTNMLKDKTGIGFNWMGIQIRKEIGNDIMLELRGQLSGDTALAAARGYMILPKIAGNIPVQPYVGLEFGLPFSTLLTGGFEAGVFGGGEVFVSKDLGLGLDAGLYFISISSDLGSISDFGIIINLGVTYYF